jgi:hypothetical protein
MVMVVVVMVVVVTMVTVIDYEEFLPIRSPSATSTIPRCSSCNILSTFSCSTRSFVITIHIF